MLCVSTSRVSRRMILFQEISGQDAAPNQSRRRLLKGRDCDDIMFSC